MHARRVLAAVLLVALAPPPRARATVVDAADASSVVGSAVTIEGDVAVARAEPMGLVLELAPVGEKSFRAVLVTALISSLPRSPERIYAGKRVRVTGLVQRFRGRPEMILESTDQIEIVDVAGAPVATTTSLAPPTTTTRPPSAPPAPTAAPAPTPLPPSTPVGAAPAPSAPAVPPPPPPTAGAAPTPPPAPEPAAPEAKPLLAERLARAACERARTRWQDVAARVRDASATLTRCLDVGAYDCRAAAAALAPVLGDLEWAEQQVADRCD